MDCLSNSLFKANYPAEYMAAVLSNNMVTSSRFLWRMQAMGLEVLGPDVNESHYKFTVNDNYAVRFGMGAIKGWEQDSSDHCSKQKRREVQISFDLTKRIDLRAANKKHWKT
jgi:DNA polymerase-3 subunit alpha